MALITTFFCCCLFIYLAVLGLSWHSGIFILACGIFSCSMQDLIPWPGIEPGPPALGARSLDRWTTREVPRTFFLFFKSCWDFFIFWLCWVLVARSSLQHARSFIVVRRLLLAVHGLSCSTAYGILVPWPRIEPASPALEGEFLTAGPPGKSPQNYFYREHFCFLFFVNSQEKS